MTTEPDTFTLSPTQSLVLEVLAARFRLGENTWTFESRHRQALTALKLHGLIGWKYWTTPHSCLAWLTDEGRKTALSDTYETPTGHEYSFTPETLTDALTRLELRVMLTGPIAGMINAELMAEAIIKALAERDRSGEHP